MCQISAVGNCGPNVYIHARAHTQSIASLWHVAHCECVRREHLTLLVFSWHGTALISPHPMIFQRDKEVCLVLVHLS